MARAIIFISAANTSRAVIQMGDDWLLMNLESAKWIFAGLYVLSTIGVIIGVYWDDDRKPKEVKYLGQTVLVWALIFDTFFTILIFATDGWISAVQKRQLNTVTSELTQYLRPRRLSDTQKDRIARLTKTFPSVEFMTVTEPEAEPWDFVMDIAAALKADGWIWLPCPGGIDPLDDGRPSSCTSILDHVQINPPVGMDGLANALADAIRDPDTIGMDNVRVDTQHRPITMTIMVGTKR
jgi:hypothetical protein